MANKSYIVKRQGKIIYCLFCTKHWDGR